MSLNCFKVEKNGNSLKMTKKRMCSRVPEPIKSILHVDDLFDKKESPDVPNIIKLKKHFLREGRLDSNLVLKIIEKGIEVFKTEPNLLRLDSPINFVGDIHGQFYDLLTVMTLGDSPSQFKYLFIGDFVDRGMFSFECICYLFCLKIKYPDMVYMLRGNHECRHLTEFFTFRNECLFKANETVYNNFMLAFDALPLCAIVDDKFFCVHGGLSPELNYINEINELDRFNEIPKHGIITDLMWADPSEESSPETNMNHPTSDPHSPEEDLTYFTENAIRGCSYYYTIHAVERFLKNNSLLCMIRGHQVQKEGIHMNNSIRKKRDYLRIDELDSDSSGISLNSFPEDFIEFPSLITIFSAPNYCDVYQNKGAMVQYTGKEFQIKLFTAVDHPYVLPNFINAFEWSLPFINEKVSEILVIILNQISDEEINTDHITNQKVDDIINKMSLIVQKTKSPSKPKLKTKEKETFLNKLNIVKKCHDAYHKEAEEADTDLMLGALTPSRRIRRRSSELDREQLKHLQNLGVLSFEDADKLDNLQYKIINSDVE